MDINFLRILSAITSIHENICIYRDSNEIVICCDKQTTYFDILDIEPDNFAVGYQVADGSQGKWNIYNEIIRIPAPITENENIDIGIEHTPLSSNVWTTSQPKNEYIEKVSLILDDMKQGKYFLANLTRELSTINEVDLLCVAMWSCLLHSTPYRYYFQDDGEIILGLSPERFLSISNNTITSEPIKGTSSTLDGLVNNDKEYNENTMMIDLVRSDLSQVCIPESIQLIERDRLSYHPGLVHLSSVLTGTLESHMTIPHTVVNMMPIASVTGVPKPFVTKKMLDYENHLRNIYCGAYGWIDMKSSSCDLAVGIRTIHQHNRKTSIGVGAGITLSSNPKDEYEETDLKASRFTNLCNLAMSPNITTSHLSTDGIFTSLSTDTNGQPIRLEQHINRLVDNAYRCKISVSQEAISEAINDFLASYSDRQKKVRIDISSLGIISCTIEDLPEANLTPIRLAIAPFPHLSSTTSVKFRNRALYETTLHHAQQLYGSTIDDTLLLVQGAITETTRSNIFLLIDDMIVTPQLSHGVLEGITRNHLIETFNKLNIKYEERVVTLDDLVCATEIAVCNSLRGIQKVGSIDSSLLSHSIDFDSELSTLTTSLQQYI